MSESIEHQRVTQEQLPLQGKLKASSTSKDNRQSNAHKGFHQRNSLDFNEDLPIFAFKDSLVKAVQDNSTTIIVGETGAGKSTQLPQYLALDLLQKYQQQQQQQSKFQNKNKNKSSGQQQQKSFNGSKSPPVPCIVCTQPRRVAAVTIAQQVASEWGCKVGEAVGYSIRFEDKTSAATCIKFVTDGVLLRECMSDRSLRRYSVVILDEAHERSLQTDILMGLLRLLQERRKDLKIVVMSATLQVKAFSDFFKDAYAMSIPGRQFPVKVLYAAAPEADFVDAAMLACLQIHEEEEDNGGVLVFLPGQDEIENLQALLEENLPCIESKLAGQVHYTTVTNGGNSSSSGGGNGGGSNNSAAPAAAIGEGLSSTAADDIGSSNSETAAITVTVQQDFVIRPLYAALPPDEQALVFAATAPGVRKFILATNIAETSVTITGIKYVVDSGFAKTRFMAENTGVEMLKVLPISRFQASQRTGRAGRESAGICLRLYTQQSFAALQEAAVPEIQRSNIAQVLLQLKVLGINSPAQFPFVSPPTKSLLRKALELLFLLGAIDKEQQLTEHGKRMALLPLDPIFAHLLLTSIPLKCVSEALTAVALLSAESVFLQPHREEQKREAAMAHRRLASSHGDLPTLLIIYESWIKAKKDRRWAAKHYLSQRALLKAQSVRDQLSALLQQQLQVDTSCCCAADSKEAFLRCLCEGLMLNIAKRSVVAVAENHHQQQRQQLVTVGNKRMLASETTTTTAAAADSNSISNHSEPSKHELKRLKMRGMAEQALSMNSSGLSSITTTVNSSGKFTFSQPAAAADSNSNNSSNNRSNSKLQSFLFLNAAHAQAAGANNSNSSNSSDHSTAPYHTLRGNQPVFVHPTSVLFPLVHNRKLPEFVVFAELLITSKHYMRNITAIDGSWVAQFTAAAHNTHSSSSNSNNSNNSNSGSSGSSSRDGINSSKDIAVLAKSFLPLQS